MPDLLAGAAWTCAPAEDGTGAIPARVPGTVAAALRDAGQWTIDDPRDFDAEEWWFRTAVPDVAGDGPWVLQLGGLATVADVWFAGRPVLHSENMFRAHEVVLDAVAAGDELVVCFRALAPLLSVKRPRPRWKTRLVTAQSLRWFRTTLLGRMPGWAGVAAPVGPWRPIRLVPSDEVPVQERRVVTRLDGDRGIVELSARLRIAPAAVPRLRVGAVEVEVAVAGNALTATLTVADAALWWPHTHGEPNRYPVELVVDGRAIALGHVGFRTVTVDRADGAFAIHVNGERIFCRGACWVPPDVVSLAASPADVRAALESVCRAGMNMVRLTGTNTYEDAAFWDACDELGILVWQDAMFANMDPPDDAAFVADVTAEVRGVLAELQGRPSLAVVCGGSEVEQQAAMLGLPRDRWTMPLFDEVLPALVDELAPGVPYVTNSPTGGELPFHVDAGVGHYYGTGAYRRPPEDARRADVRFTTECLAFATPPEGGGWARVPRDNATDWDFADVTRHYAEALFGGSSLDQARATVSHLMTVTMREWRRAGSRCDGALVFTLRDLWPGSGWGVLDAAGEPKAPWYALRRVLQPVAVLVTDEGLNGLHLDVVNDRPTPFAGRVVVELFAPGELRLEEASAAVAVPARGHVALVADALFSGFRDLTYAYRFGEPAHDVVVVTLLDDHGDQVSQAVHLPRGQARPMEPELGLRASAKALDPGSWLVVVETRRFAQAVALDVPGHRPDDNWFDLAPGARASVTVRGAGPPRGHVRALNLAEPVEVTVEP